MKKYIKYTFFGLMILSSLYICFFVDKLFVSEIRIVLGNLEEKQQIQGFATLGTDNSLKDAELVSEYLKSYEVLSLLEKEINISKELKSRNNFFNSLSDTYSKKDFLDTYVKNVKTIYNQQSGSLEIKYSSTNPEMSYNVVKKLISYTEDKLNNQNREISKKHLVFMKQISNDYKTELDKSTEAVLFYQNKIDLLDPKMTAETISSSIASLEIRLFNKQSELSSYRDYMKENAFEVISLSKEVSSIENQINKLKKQLTGQNELNSEIIAFKKLQAKVDFDFEMYKNSVHQLEKLNEDISKNSKIILNFTDFGIPDEPTEPNKFILLFVVNTLLLLCMFIVLSLKTIIKEH